MNLSAFGTARGPKAGSLAAAVLIAGTALLAGCYRTADPLVGEADRVEVVELSPGRYCAAGLDWSGAIRIDADDCRDLAFDAKRRVYLETRDWENADWSVEHQVARLGEGFYLTQVVEPAAAELHYTLVPFVAGAEGFAVIGDVREDGFGAAASAFTDIVTAPPDRYEAGRLLGGDPARARALIALAAREDATAWLADEGAADALVIYVRVMDTDDQGRVMARYATTVDALSARFPRLRR